ncbi:MAG: hypothetical protein P8Q92_04775, partial [Pseudoprimorskyibacter sp.]|nr:hypothetical protein [Pseudoprimorskyibacter sp.]
WVLQSAPTPLSIGLEKPRRFRKESGLNEHLGRHETVTGPTLDIGANVPLGCKRDAAFGRRGILVLKRIHLICQGVTTGSLFPGVWPSHIYKWPGLVSKNRQPVP